MVVTSGTGSGKTESFLVPVIARLLQERLGNVGQGGLHKWWHENWNSSAGNWQGSRSRIVDGPEPALRALLLYPTNALVEDQVSRLRRAATRARDIHGAPMFYFGRYTGATPGGTFDPSGHLDAKGRRQVKDLAREIKQIEEEAARLADRDEEIRGQFQDPSCGEMLTRWDMIDAPPDIMITNVSMLNVMLMREHEAQLFQQTRDWLAASEDHHFSLVVDELHGYRGTAGTEVALVIRNLLMRLGLESGSPQLRCLGTSASLDGEEGKEYLEQFFGVDRKTFEVFPGEPRIPQANLPVISAGKVAPVAEYAIKGDKEALENIIARGLAPRGARRGLPCCRQAGRRRCHRAGAAWSHTDGLARRGCRATRSSMRSCTRRRTRNRPRSRSHTPRFGPTCSYARSRACGPARTRGATRSRRRTAIPNANWESSSSIPRSSADAVGRSSSCFIATIAARPTSAAT